MADIDHQLLEPCGRRRRDPFAEIRHERRA
jgi:hypothetical protein